MAIFSVELFYDVVGKVVMHLPVLKGCTVFAVYRGDMVHTKIKTIEI